MWELTCTVFSPSPLGSAENDSEMQNSGSVEMQNSGSVEMQNSGSVEMCRGH